MNSSYHSCIVCQTRAVLLADYCATEFLVRLASGRITQRTGSRMRAQVVDALQTALHPPPPTPSDVARAELELSHALDEQAAAAEQRRQRKVPRLASRNYCDHL